MTTYPLRRGAAILTGLALIGAETLINLSHVRDAALVWHEQPLVIAVGVAGIAQAVAVSVLAAALQQRRWLLCLITLLGLSAAVAFSFSATYERTAAAREAKRIAIQQGDKDRRIASIAVATAEQRQAAECVTRGPECRKREVELGEARARLIALPQERETRLLGQLDVVPELALPIMLMLLGFAFIAFVDEPKRREAKPAGDSAQTSFPTDIEPPPAARFQPDADELGERERKVTDFVRAHVQRHGRMPRHREVMQATGLPRATASRYLKRARAVA